MFWCLVGSNTSWPSASTRQTFNVENDLKVFHLPSPVVLFGHISLCWPSEMRASWANVWLGVRSRGLRNKEFYSHIISTEREIFFGTHFNILLVSFNDTPSTFDITFTFLPSFPCSTSFPLWGITSNSSVVPSCAFDTCNSHDFQETCNLDFRKKSEKENILSVVGQSLSTNSHIFCEA